MSYLEELRKSKNKPQVAFQEFALSTRKFPNHLFCFFEGKDNAYYVPRIKQFTQDYHPIKCGGREKILDIHRLIKNQNEYNNYKKAIFIDRDFNAPLKPYHPPIFETPCYSIENLYVSVRVFREILTNEFHLSAASDSSFETSMVFFVERQKEFHEAVTLLNAWYACLIEVKNSTGILTGVNLDDKLPRDFVEFSLQSIHANYNMERIIQTFPQANRVTDEALKNKLYDFSNCDQSKIFRGKYEMQFLIKFIQLLLEDSKNTKTVIKDKINFAFGDGSGLNNEQSINIFEGYAETPESLVAYLKEVIN